MDKFFTAEIAENQPIGTKVLFVATQNGGAVDWSLAGVEQELLAIDETV